MGDNMSDVTPYDERSEESGKFTPEFSDRDFLGELSEDPTTTSEVADAVGCNYQTAYVRLKSLRDDGRADSEKYARTLVWTVDE